VRSGGRAAVDLDSDQTDVLGLPFPGVLANLKSEREVQISWMLSFTNFSIFYTNLTDVICKEM